ncbi:hypothetical protein PoB_001368400 [Plakobranchus ocellatus]|uniref:Uncharacterized protein n=1 Tax=Plakobranchus ocellatus TaxID=259542 RepID=A0AAV3YVT1_9GAST|nr:hypothetical protein PoB_001368400 [Plakobranchus ocellatus]
MASREINDYHIDDDLENVFHTQLRSLDLEVKSSAASKTIDTDEENELKCYRNPLFVEDDDLVKDHAAQKSRDDVDLSPQNSQVDDEGPISERNLRSLDEDLNISSECLIAGQKPDAVVDQGKEDIAVSGKSKGTPDKRKNTFCHKKSRTSSAEDAEGKGFDIDQDKGKKGKRKYNPKTRNSNQNKNITKRERSKSVSSAVDSSLGNCVQSLSSEGVQGKKNHLTLECKKNEKCKSGRELKGANDGSCCTDSGIEVTAELHHIVNRRDELRDFVDANFEQEHSWVDARRVKDIKNSHCNSGDDTANETNCPTLRDVEKEISFTAERQACPEESRYDALVSTSLANVARKDQQNGHSSSSEGKNSTEPDAPSHRNIDSSLTNDVSTFESTQRCASKGISENFTEGTDGDELDLSCLSPTENQNLEDSAMLSSPRSGGADVQASGLTGDESSTSPAWVMQSLQGEDGLMPHTSDNHSTSADFNPDAHAVNSDAHESDVELRLSTNL